MRIIYIVCVVLGVVSCNKKTLDLKSFTLHGVTKGFNDSTEVLIYYPTLDNNRWNEVCDTTYIIQGKFHFTGNIKELTSAVLVFDNIDVIVYLEPTDIKFIIDKDKPYIYELSGTTTEKENIALQNKLSTEMKSYYERADSINEIFKYISLYGNNSILLDSLMQKLYQFKETNMINVRQIDSIRLDFAINYNEYQITPHLLYIISKNNSKNDSIMYYYNNLPEYSKTTLLGKLALEQIRQNERSLNRKDLRIGDVAPNFSRESMQGKIIRLADFREENYILLDFWASWCGPCIKGIPELKGIYKNNDKNSLKIIGISLDSDKEEWLNAINKYHINMWPQILSDYDPDNNYFSNENDISEIYNIKSIPLYIIIDRHGKIIAQWEHLEKEQLAELESILSSDRNNEIWDSSNLSEKHEKAY